MAKSTLPREAARLRRAIKEPAEATVLLDCLWRVLAPWAVGGEAR